MKCITAWKCIQRRCDISFPKTKRQKRRALFSNFWWRDRDMSLRQMQKNRDASEKINFLIAFEAAAALRWIINSKVSRVMSRYRCEMRGQERDKKRKRNKGEIIRNAGNSGYENMQTIKNYVCPTNRESSISIRQLSNAHQKKKHSKKPFKSLCSLITKFDYRRFWFFSSPAFPSSIPLWCRNKRTFHKWRFFIHREIIKLATQHHSNPFPIPTFFFVSTPTSEFLSSLSNLRSQKDENRFVINVKRSHATARDLHILPRAPPQPSSIISCMQKLVLLIFHNLFFHFSSSTLKTRAPGGRWKSVYSYGFRLSGKKGLDRSWLLVTWMRYLVD